MSVIDEWERSKGYLGDRHDHFVCFNLGYWAAKKRAIELIKAGVRSEIDGDGDWVDEVLEEL